jgi:hypothetical protein
MHQIREKFALAVIGLVQHEERALRSLCWLSASRPSGYELSDLSRSPGPDIVIVDGDDADAIVKWHQFADRLKDEAHRPVPAIWVSAKRPSHKLYYHIHRPFVAGRLLNLLDEITEKDSRIAHVLAEKKQTTETADFPRATCALGFTAEGSTQSPGRGRRPSGAQTAGHRAEKVTGPRHFRRKR